MTINTGRAGATSQETARPAEPGDHELARLVQSLPPGDARRDAACEMLIERHRSIVWACARRYRAVPDLADDLMQVGYVGLLKAISSFDPAIGGSLAAYAQPSVSGEIKRYFRDKRWQVRVRRPVQELRLEIRKASPGLAQQLARDPRDCDLARHLRVSEADVRDARRAEQALWAQSLDAPAGEHGTDSLGDILGGADPQIQQVIDMASVRTHWAELPAREQRMLLMRFYGNMTQAQIGAQMGISQMHVSRLITRALGHLRQRLTEPAGQPCTGS